MQEIEFIIFALELIGTIAFASSGAILAIKKNMDLFGVNVMALITAVGGGGIRDIIIGNLPPMMFRNSIYVMVALLTASVTQVIQLLERDGLIVRESVERDARLKKLVLTEKAIRIQEVMNGKIRELESQMQKDISEEEREILLNLLRKIKRNIV